MAIVRNKDIELLKEIELYLYNVNSNVIYRDNDMFAIDKKDVKDIKALELYFNLYELVERLVNTKKQIASRQNVRNKSDREYHRITNNITNAKKNNDIQKLEYYRKKLEDYNKRKEIEKAKNIIESEEK